MADGRGIQWENDSLFTEAQVATILKALHIRIEGETESVFQTYCPFHGNHDTPSFAVNKTDGLYICFNPACARSGNMMGLVKTLGNMNDFDAKRLVVRSRRDTDIQEQLIKMVEPQENFPEYIHHDKNGWIDLKYMARAKQNMWKYAEPQLYMRGRGFEKETLEKFQIGFDTESNMICVPMHDPMGKVEVGAVRRSIEGKIFKNTPGLPTSKTLFNLHRAKRTGDTVIVVEASFSAMRLDQCGYPNAVSILMGHFSKEHASLLNKYFNKIVIMTDYDKKQMYPNCGKCKQRGSNLCMGHNPGEELGMRIADWMDSKDLMWAHCGEATRFPEGIKDPDDMDDEMIRHCIKNSVSHFEYALD